MTAEEVLRACKELGLRPDALGYVTDQQASALMGVSLRTLAYWREQGDGPVYIQRGGRIRYGARAIAEYYTALESKSVQNAAERREQRLARKGK